MDYVVEKVSERLRIEPTGGQGRGQQQRRENPPRKGEHQRDGGGERRDTVHISDEARKKSQAENDLP